MYGTYMTMKPRGEILVTGATGNVGRPVVDLLVAAGVPVRAAGSSREAVVSRFGGEQELARRAITPVGLDFTDSATWPGAYEGVTQMFLMRPPHLGKPRTQMLASLEAAKAAGVKHIVLLSLQGAEHNKVVPHAALEKWLRESGLDWTFVRPSFFMQNLTTTHLRDIRDRDQVIVPAGNGATAFVDTADVAAVAAQALLHPDAHRNQAWTPTGSQALTYTQIADTLSTVLGRTITYTRPGILTWIRHARSTLGMPWAMVGVTTAIYTIARLGRADGLTRDVHTVTGRDPVTFQQFAEQNRDTWNPASRS